MKDKVSVEIREIQSWAKLPRARSNA